MITEFNNRFIIRSSRFFFFFFDEYLREVKRSATFTQERSQEVEKRGFAFTHDQNINIICSQTQAQHSWATVRMSRPLFVGSYL